MPIEVKIWNITGNEIKNIDFSPIDSEQRLEAILSKDISILGSDYLVIGRQLMSPFGKFLDLLSINQDGNLTVIELKKNKTPRDVVSQVLDYASWIKDLSYDDIKTMCEEHYEGQKFESIFEEKFGITPPEKLNQEHDMLIVSSQLDNETERILNYMSDYYSVPINAVFFRIFRDKDSEYLCRSWLIDPNEVVERSTKSVTQSKGEEWNGKDFVVNIDANRSGVSTWTDCQKYGFISASGGKWYTNTLNQLFIGARVFAMIPNMGYVGVGIVKNTRAQVKEFNVKINGSVKPIREMKLNCEGYTDEYDCNDLEKCAYFVQVDWIKTAPEEKAYWEKGLRANQNSAFKLKNKFTLEKLVEHFELDE